MKLKAVVFLFALFSFLPVFSIKAANPIDSLKGKILLQVESHGEAWYVNPKDGNRHYMKDGEAALKLMREVGVGISNDNLKKIAVAEANLEGDKDLDSDGLSDSLEEALGTDKAKADSDSDGYKDKAEIINGYNPLGLGKNSIDLKLSKSQAGKILLQVGGKGETWYVNPSNNKRYFLGRPGDAYNLMRSLGLGITNSNLKKVIEKKTINQVQTKQASSSDEFVNNLSSCKAYKTNFIHPFTGETMDKEIFGIVDAKCKYIEQMPNGGQMECKYTESERIAVAKYYLDIAKASSSETEVSFSLNKGSVKNTYTINGKIVENPLQEALNNGACVIYGYDDSSEKNGSNLNGKLEIEWGKFVIAKNRSKDDVWKTDITITNNEDKMVVLEISGAGKTRNWSLGAEKFLKSGESWIYNLDFEHYSFNQTAYDKKDIKISAYECNKLSTDDAAGICLSTWGDNGKKSPRDFIKSKEDAGTPIRPTLISQKYFNFNSLTIPPLEISKEEFLK